MKKERCKRNQSLGEEIGNGVTHGVGFLLSVAATVLLYINCDRWQEYLSVTLFSVSMMMLYLSSTLYHSFKSGSVVKRIFKRFDHSSIYLLIAGTFAPILLAGVGTKLAFVMFIIQWICVILGIVSKCIWPTKYKALHLIVYLMIGWSGVLFIPDLIKLNVNLVWFILAGGISYSIGVVFYTLSKVKYFHFVWHFFVLGGTILHFLGVLLYII